MNFQRLWIIFPIPRTIKELVKGMMFLALPFIFKHFKAYRNWKQARVFSGDKDKIRNSLYWKNLIRGFYEVPVFPESESMITDINSMKLAIVIHCYYIDVFEEILIYLKRSDYQCFKLYVTHPFEWEEKITELLVKSGFEYYTRAVENKGRDVLPFLKITPEILKEKCDVVLKLHTKKSNYLKKKQLWSQVLFNELIGEGRIQKNMEILNTYSCIGILAPAGNIVPLSLYYGSNGEKLIYLAAKTGLEKEYLKDMVFVAGTMFYARREILDYLMNLALNDRDFDPEDSQIDGTLAHVVERAVTLGLIDTRLQLADSDSKPDKISCRVILNHPYVI